MARRKVIEEVGTEVARSQNLSKLRTLVARWGKNKSEADALGKVVKEDADQIKQTMLSEGLDESESDGYVANISFRCEESFDEDGLLSFIKSDIWGGKGSMECPYIKYVEVIDWDALEKAVYNGDISQDQVLKMDKYKSVKRTPVLKLNMRKESKDD